MVGDVVSPHTCIDAQLELMCCAVHILPVVFDVSCTIMDAFYRLSVYIPFFCHCFLVLTNDKLCVVNVFCG